MAPFHFPLPPFFNVSGEYLDRNEYSATRLGLQVPLPAPNLCRMKCTLRPCAMPAALEPYISFTNTDNPPAMGAQLAKMPFPTSLVNASASNNCNWPLLILPPLLMLLLLLPGLLVLGVLLLLLLVAPSSLFVMSSKNRPPTPRCSPLAGK